MRVPVDVDFTVRVDAARDETDAGWSSEGNEVSEAVARTLSLPKEVPTLPEPTPILKFETDAENLLETPRLWSTIRAEFLLGVL